MVQLSQDVKAGEETKVAGSEIHAQGDYVFQFDQGFELKVNEEGKHGTGPSYTYVIKIRSVDAGKNGDQASVGRNLKPLICNISYHDAEGNEKMNDGGLKMFSAVMVHSGVLNEGGDYDLTNPQFADSLKLKLDGKIFGGTVAHGKEKAQKQTDDGNWVDYTDEEWKELDKERQFRTVAFIQKVFPVSGGVGGGQQQAQTAQTNQSDW